MKRFFCVLSFFAALFCAAPGWAETRAPKIAPHRAIYRMSLSKVKNGSAILGVSGTMLFDWSDACDGWAIQQHMKLRFSYAEGDEGEVDSAVVTWESKDGKKYHFNVRRLVGGQEDEVFRGRAIRDDKGEGEARYAVPKEKKPVKLSPDMLFPSAHTEMILQKAAAGEKLFTRPVFDGSDEAGYALVSAFIGARADKPKDEEISPELRGNPLLEGPAWPVRLAFYIPDDQTGEPDYEMDLMLQANGVARSMNIDYGDFSVSGVLASVESVPGVSCSAEP